MSKSLFRYIWRHSRRDQLIIFMVVLASLPFYYVSLDLPRKIVNEAIQGRAFEQGQTTAPFMNFTWGWPAWLGGGKVELFHGFQLERLELLLGLSFLFLFFVLVNGWFKYWINVEKGSLGERMMRRMRFELFSYALRFTPEALRTVKSSEAATIIKDEVEPIGGFIGDAFIQPVFLGTQAATALLFIMMQSVWLGLIAAGVVGIQFVIIPRMRRELLRLGRMRQIASRRLAGRVSEVIDGMEAVQVHDTGRWERAEIGHRLYELFDIRFRIYKRKFIVKFLNNLLAQMTPFFFYAIGGYFALRGTLDIGQLVAVIAAYRELPPPLKELIDWDQQRLDVQVKYDQVVGYFAPERLRPEDGDTDEADDAPLDGPLDVRDLTLLDHNGNPLVSGASFRLDLPAHVALVAEGGPASGMFARLLAGRGGDFSGEVKAGERDLPHLNRATLARHVAYAGVDPILFPVSLRENILYGLRQSQLDTAAGGLEEERRLHEADRTGNPADNIEAEWIDVSRAGAANTAGLDRRLVDLLGRMGMEGDVYRFGINGMIDPERQPRLAEQIVGARERLRDKLRDEGMADLVEPFDPERYNTQATVAENLLFGVPTSPTLIGRALADHPGVREALDKGGLTDELVVMGAQIAATMVDIFRGLPAGHPLFDQFSFVHADELDDYEAIGKRHASRGRVRGGARREDRNRLLALTLPYIEPRHRLGLLTDELRAKLLAARALVHAMLKDEGGGVSFYEAEELNPAAPLRDNLLFGRVNERVADARERVRAAGAAVLQELDLRADIERVGLDHQVGPAGRLLTAPQRAAVNLARCLIKRPDILIVDGALAPLGDRRAGPVLDTLVAESAGRSLFVVLPDERGIERFDTLVRFAGTGAEIVPIEGQDQRPGGSTAGELPDNENRATPVAAE